MDTLQNRRPMGSSGGPPSSHGSVTTPLFIECYSMMLLFRPIDYAQCATQNGNMIGL